MTATTVPTTPTTRRRGRRLAALALAATSLLGVVGLDAQPASAGAAPGVPRPIQAAGYHDHARLYWAPPVTGGKVAHYEVQRTAINSDTPQELWQYVPTLILDEDLQPGTQYRYKIRSVNADGKSAWVSINTFTNPGRQDMFQFASAEAFVTRQYEDFLGRKPSPFELATDAQAIEFGDSTPAEVIDKLVFNPQRQGQRAPIIRLYRAFFDRAPDHSGLDYWVGKRKTGTTTLNDIAAKFAGSNEFKTKYGTISHAQFLDLIYDNLFDRAPDPSGKAYWTKKLNEGMSRGKVMVQFSESEEYKTRSRGVVITADVRDDMLDDAGPAETVNLWGAHVQQSGLAGNMALTILLLPQY